MNYYVYREGERQVGKRREVSSGHFAQIIQTNHRFDVLTRCAKEEDYREVQQLRCNNVSLTELSLHTEHPVYTDNNNLCMSIC